MAQNETPAAGSSKVSDGVSRSEDLGLSIFLGLMVFGLFLLIPGGPGEDGGPLMTTFLTLLFISATLTAVERRGVRLLAVILTVAAVSSHWASVFMADVAVASARLLSAMALLLVITVSLAVQTFRPGRVSSHRVRGAVAIYLLIGLIWAFAYAILDLHIPDAFTEAHSRHTADLLDLKEVVYFSFVTLTTVGYGDMAPRAPAIRSLAVLEALLGQLYLAVTLARLVSMELTERSLRRVGVCPTCGQEAETRAEAKP